MRSAFHHDNKRASGPTRRRRWPLAALAAACALAAAASAWGSGSPQQPAYNPFQAEKELEVGRFYLKKGKYDAAIIRFQNAQKYKPEWAMPHLYLGEAYQKRGDLKRAVGEYQEYLKITPYAKDAREISKRVDKLTEQIKRGRSSSGAS